MENTLPTFEDVNPSDVILTVDDFNETAEEAEEQEVEVYPTETYNGIIVETKELNGSDSSRMYLNVDEMELLISKMREMMEYVKK
jgi:hypothetical protein